MKRFVSVVSILSLLGNQLAFANPVGGTVASGSATINSSGSNLTVIQTTDKAMIDWRKFDIAPQETTKFQQPASTSLTVNRINDVDSSKIEGALQANGNLVLINPNGILFGQGSKVDVSGIVATSSNINEKQFKNGKLVFDQPGKADARMVNEGTITAKDAGLVGLIAPQVENRGSIKAKLGKVNLASGDAYTLDLAGDGLIQLAVTGKVKDQIAANSGVIDAQGGEVYVTAAAARDVVNSLVANSGTISAKAVGSKSGKVRIFAEGSIAVEGNQPKDKGQKAGSSNALNSGVIDVSGYGKGETGGKIRILADNVGLLNGSLIDASGNQGGGDIRIGGNYLGTGATPAAKNTFVDTYTLIYNDAISRGDGGRTIVWSDGTTGFYGNIYGRGGKESGNGGFTETSGHGFLDAQGVVDLTAAKGEKGTYLLDPTDITIYGNVDPAFTSTDSTINLTSSLKFWLDASDSSKVTITYSTDNLSSATATGTLGANTITTSVNVASSLAVGSRIRLGAAGSVTTADTLGADTYIISGISGTTITLSGNLTSNYLGSTVYRGLVSQVTDKSSQGNNILQGTQSLMPLWTSNGLNGLGALLGDAINDRMQTGNFSLSTPLTGFATFNYLTAGSNYGVLYDGTTDNSNNPSRAVAGAFGTYQNGFRPNVANPLPLNTNFVSSQVIPTAGGTETFTLNGAQYSASYTSQSVAMNGVKILGDGVNGEAANALIGDMIFYNTNLSTNAINLVNQYQSTKWGIALTPPGTGATEVAKATASDGYSVFTTRYLERLSQSANIALQATNNIKLDLKTDTLNLATSGRSLTLTAGNQITTGSAGTITTNAGNIALNATNGIALSHAIGLNSTGGNINLNNNVTLGASQVWNAGSGTLTTGGKVDGGYNLTATAGTFSLGKPLGATTALSNVSLASTNALALPTIFASGITATTSAGNITGTGGLVTSGGAIDVTADSSHDLDFTSMGIISNNGNVTLGGRDVTLNTGINTGTGNFTVNAVRDLFIAKNDLTTGLVSYYKFDEGSGTTATDSKGSNNGTLTNGLTYSSSNPYGISGQYSLSFDGVNDYASVVNSAALRPALVSWGGWLNTTRTNGAVQQVVRSVDGATGGFGYSMFVGNTAGKVGVALNVAGVPVVEGDISANAWNYVIGTYDGTTLKLYINGALVSSAAASGAITYGSSTLNFGANIGSSASQPLAGNFDEMRVYNTAISANDISKLYAPQTTWTTGTTTLNATRNVSLDLKGDTMTLGAGKNLTVSAGGNISSSTAGTIATSQSSGSGGNITMAAGGSGTLDLSNMNLTSTGGAISLTSPGAMTLGTMSGGTIAAQTTGATSDLTIASGKTLTASGSGNAITLAAGRNFINSAGASALSSASGRWLVYSTNPANDTIGSLNNSFRRFTCTYGGSCPSFPGAGNGFLYSYTPTLTATPSSQSIIYADAVPSLSGYGYGLTGYLGSDSSADGVSGSLTGTTTYTQGSNVGSYNINYSSGSLTSDLGYGFTYANNSSAITVGKKTLTPGLTGSVTKSYDGDTTATLAANNYSLTGVYNSEDVSLNNPSSGTYDTKDANTGKTVSVAGLTLAGTKAGNYQLSSASASGAVGAINKKTVDATLSNKTITQGTVTPTLSATDANDVLWTGFISGEDATGLTSVNFSYGGANPGVAAATGTYALNVDSLTATNYSLGTSTPGTLAVKSAGPYGGLVTSTPPIDPGPVTTPPVTPPPAPTPVTPEPDPVVEIPPSVISAVANIAARVFPPPEIRATALSVESANGVITMTPVIASDTGETAEPGPDNHSEKSRHCADGEDGSCATENAR